MFMFLLGYPEYPLLSSGKKQQRWAGAMTQTLLHNSEDHFSDQAEK